MHYGEVVNSHYIARLQPKKISSCSALILIESDGDQTLWWSY